MKQTIRILAAFPARSRYDPANPVHQWLTALSQQAHELAAPGDKAGLTVVEAQVDAATAELWGITEGEFQEIRRSLMESA